MEILLKINKSNYLIKINKIFKNLITKIKNKTVLNLNHYSY